MSTSRQVKGIENFQIKKMWALAYKLGMDKDDVYALAGVEHLHELTYLEANEVIGKLLDFTDDKKSVAGMINTSQIKKVWALMYELKKQDAVESDIPVGKRLCGIIEKELKITATEKDPFKWVDFSSGKKLIDALSRYVKYAKKKGGKVGKS